MATKISKSLIPEVLDFLSQELPRSCWTYFPLKYVQSGRLMRNVWVDQWPDCKAVVLTPIHWNRDNTKMNVLSIYALKDSNLQAILNEPAVVEKERWFTSGVPDYLSPVVETVLLNGPGSSFVVPTFETHITMTSSDITYHGKLQSKFTERRLTLDDAGLLASHWHELPGFEEYVRECIAVTGRSICITDKEGQPIAWAVKHIFGSIGIAYVLKPYRGIGLGKYIAATLAREVIAEDGFCATTILSTNTPSLKVLEAIGFKRIDTDSTFSQLLPRTKSLNLTKDDDCKLS